MCIGALPPFDHPHIFIDMGADTETVCPYCSTRYVYAAALGPHASPGRVRTDGPGRLIRAGSAPAVTEPLHVIIAGAGIGGLCAALALAKAGARVTLLERAPVMEAVGAGLQLVAQRVEHPAGSRRPRQARAMVARPRGAARAARARRRRSHAHAIGPARRRAVGRAASRRAPGRPAARAHRGVRRLAPDHAEDGRRGAGLRLRDGRKPRGGAGRRARRRAACARRRRRAGRRRRIALDAARAARLRSRRQPRVFGAHRVAGAHPGRAGAARARCAWRPTSGSAPARISSIIRCARATS